MRGLAITHGGRCRGKQRAAGSLSYRSEPSMNEKDSKAPIAGMPSRCQSQEIRTTLGSILHTSRAGEQTKCHRHKGPDWLMAYIQGCCDLCSKGARKGHNAAWFGTEMDIPATVFTYVPLLCG
jgi:hypothetical protein